MADLELLKKLERAKEFISSIEDYLLLAEKKALEIVSDNDNPLLTNETELSLQRVASRISETRILIRGVTWIIASQYETLQYREGEDV